MKPAQDLVFAVFARAPFTPYGGEDIAVDCNAMVRRFSFRHGLGRNVASK